MQDEKEWLQSDDMSASVWVPGYGELQLMQPPLRQRYVRTTVPRVASLVLEHMVS